MTAAMPDELVRLQGLLERPHARSFLTQLPDEQTALEGGQLLLEYCNRLDGICVFAHIWPDFDSQPTHYRSYNDHVALWRELSRRMQEVLPADSFCAQLNGGIILAVYECEDEEALAESLSLALQDLYAEPLSVNGRMVTVRCRSSRVFYPADTGKVQSFSQLGRLMMGTATYNTNDMTDREHAQRTVRHIRYTDERDALLAEALPGALERAELNACYRARASLSTGAVEAAEVILRWKHPVLGDVSQAEIWRNAIERGWSNELATYAVASAVTDLCAWRQCSPTAEGMCVGLKLPALALYWQGEQLLHDLTELLEAVQCPPEQVEIYLIERDFVTPEQPLWDAIERMRAAGFRLVLDEFGSGGGQLDLLIRLQPDAVRLQPHWHRDATFRDDYLRSARLVAETLMIPAWVEGMMDERQYIAACRSKFESGYGPYLGPTRSADAFMESLINPVE